jgi:hypothetical protein
MGDSWPYLKQHVFSERYCAQHAGKNNALPFCILKLNLFLLTFLQVLADIAINPALFLPANR